MTEEFVRIMRNMRVRFGQPPRAFSFMERSHLRIFPPIWCLLVWDDLLDVYRHQRLLVEEGIVVWGHLVQANQRLFSPGIANAPACAIYSTDMHWGDTLIPLSEMAERLFALKDGGGQTPQEQAYGAMLANELDRSMGIPVPETIGGTHGVISTALMFHRKHLPGGALNASYFPLLIHPTTKATMVLPSRYWHEDLLQMWKG